MKPFNSFDDSSHFALQSSNTITSIIKLKTSATDLAKLQKEGLTEANLFNQTY